MFATDPLAPPIDGRQSETALMIQRGVGRFLRNNRMAMVTELPLASGRRADIVAVDNGGEIWIVEIKSSVEDFRADFKWPDYRLHCDRLFFATHAGVPADLFPEDPGLIIADAYGAEIIRRGRGAPHGGRDAEGDAATLRPCRGGAAASALRSADAPT